MSLSSELPAGMWQGISSTHHWPFMCLYVMTKVLSRRYQNIYQ